MKHSLFTLIALGIINGAIAQCTPDPIYSGITEFGFYPDSMPYVHAAPSGPTITRSITHIGLTDILVYYEFTPGSPQPLIYYFDQTALIDVTGLPVGMSFGTDVESGLAPETPWGHWDNVGAVPNMAPANGCFYVSGGAAQWHALIGGGPNNDGIYPIQLEIDARIAGSFPDISSIINNGSWLSDVPVSLGGGIIPFTTYLRVAECSGLPAPEILGPTTVNPFTPYNYFISQQSGYEIAWSVENGIITDGQGTTNATVVWGETGYGVLVVTLTNSTNCSVTDTLTFGTPPIPTGLADEASTSFQVFPNPSNGLFKITGLNGMDQVQFSLSNSLGQIIETGVTNGEELELNLINSPIGVYTLMLVDGTSQNHLRLVRQ
jgi:hypothetical protein